MLPKKILRTILEDVDKILSEGGLWGHMSHLYDDPSLSFAEIKEVFELASEGKLENVTEKTDGQNIFFSYNLGGGGLRFARNQSNIKTGGMNAQDIIEKWSNVPHIQKAYHTAYIVLARAIEALDIEEIKNIFGENANIWYSAEVIYSDSPNVINYDNNALAIHESGTIYGDDGKPIEGADTSKNFAILNNAIDRMQKIVSSTGWTIMGPVVLQLKKATDGNAAKTASAILDKEIGKYSLNESNTIEDYIAKKFAAYAKVFVKDITDEEALQFGEIFASTDMSGSQKKKTALQIKNSEKVEKLFLAKNANNILKKMIRPLELIVHNFAVNVLDGVHSVIALHPDKEIKRLRQAVGEEIEKIKQSGDEKMLETLASQLEKLGGVDRITSSLEGIVFTYKGKTYKLTGNFAPINNLLGLLRYSK